MINSPRRRSVLLRSLVFLIAVPALSACTAGDRDSSPAAGVTDPAADGASSEEAVDTSASEAADTDGTYTAIGLPSPHVHGVAHNSADDRVYLATHDGLFRYEPEGPVRVGPVIDLMGFTVAGPDHFLASGHPGPGTDLPQPVGLIESVDGGITWTVQSRGGQSDFHALTAAREDVIGFDAVLRRSDDMQNWSRLEPPVAPYSIAASTDGHIVMTSQSGPIRSSDDGQTWEDMDNAPLLQVVDWAEGSTVVGVTPDGTVAVSEDAGATWATRAQTGDAPQAVDAYTRPDGSLSVLVVTSDTVLESSDGAVTFAPLLVR